MTVDVQINVRRLTAPGKSCPKIDATIEFREPGDSGEWTILPGWDDNAVNIDCQKARKLALGRHAKGLTLSYRTMQEQAKLVVTALEEAILAAR